MGKSAQHQYNTHNVVQREKWERSMGHEVQNKVNTLANISIELHHMNQNKPLHKNPKVFF